MNSNAVAIPLVYFLYPETGYRSLEENQRVEFDVAQGPKGLQAENIRPV